MNNMKTEILPFWAAWVISCVALIVSVLISLPIEAQQHIIASKDDTRPATGRQYNQFNLIAFSVIQQEGYNEIQWQVPPKATANKFVVEYSFDGVSFLQDQQVLSGNNIYNYQHYIRDTRPLLYRIRTEDLTGAINFSGAILPKGGIVSPVQLQKNVVEGNVLNVTAQFPVERLTIVSATGLQMFAKDVNGLRDFIPVAIPSLERGVYLITFYGRGWKSTSRFVIG